MTALGFGAWLNRFFDPANLTGKKAVFYVAVVLLVVGVILFVVGKIKSAKAGEHDKQTQKGIKFFRDLKGEFKKITWPTLPTVVRNTGVTLALCAILGVIICLIDLGCGALIKLMQALG
ncbi:MAG: preprotein translocase subunit SecE [Clostridia bacterium]|nr:preprotein translocase subunit SecE [Clostridia bacterium]